MCEERKIINTSRMAGNLQYSSVKYQRSKNICDMWNLSTVKFLQSKKKVSENAGKKALMAIIVRREGIIACTDRCIFKVTRVAMREMTRDSHVNCPGINAYI